nr:hypothetical protein [Bryobacteraceae bacterium]
MSFAGWSVSLAVERVGAASRGSASRSRGAGGAAACKASTPAKLRKPFLNN